MEPDTFRPSMAINKEVELRFAFGQDHAEFHRSLTMIARLRRRPVAAAGRDEGLDGVAPVLEQLADPEQHAKILIDPQSTLLKA